MRPADPDRVVRHVGRRFAELRQAADLTQEELAEKSKVSLKYLQRIERGENLTVRSLVKFTNALGVSILELFVPPRSTRRPTGRPPSRR